MSEQREYLDVFGRSPFGEWRASLDEFTRTRVTVALLRLKAGNISHVKSVGEGVSELKMDFGPGYRVYFARDGSKIVILLGGGTKKRQAPISRRLMSDGSTISAGRAVERRMPLTRDFKETVLDDMTRSPGFRAAMLREGIDALLAREYEVGKEILRDYVNATMGFDALSKEVGIPPKSLMRMLGPSGNPQMKNLFAVIAALREHAGIELHIAAE